MISKEMKEKYRIYFIYALSLIGSMTFFATFFEYFTGQYSEFVSTYAFREGWHGSAIMEVFTSSSVRFVLRLSYVISFIGLFFLRRWGVYLCLIAWLGQLLPSALFSLLLGHGIDQGHIFSFVSLLAYLAVIALCWPVLKPGRAFRFCGGALLAGLLLHTCFFVYIFTSAQAVAATDDPARQNQLWRAVNNSDTETVRSLLADKEFHPRLAGKGCGPNAICDLISYAAMAKKGDVEIVHMLHQAGSPIDLPDGSSGDTPIIRAMLSGHIDIAEYLAKAGIDPMKVNRFGVSAFVVASGVGSSAILDAMIKSGAPVNFRQKLPDMMAKEGREVIDGVTPLMVAAFSGEIDLIESLLKNGADPSLVDQKGRNAYSYAIFGKNPTIEPKMRELSKRYASN